MSEDPELRAMKDVYQSLKDLEDDAKSRVINWVSSRFSLKVAKKPQGDAGKLETGDTGQDARKLTDFRSIADVFAAAKPQSTTDKALVVAAYLQEIKGSIDVSGREINKELTQMGYGVKNITRAVEPLINAKPKLLIQTRKEGKTRQAQKKYRVTSEGFTQVATMLSGSAGREG